LPVRLFIGNLPYGATEADLRVHFAAVAEPSHIAMPVDRETGRPRGFAFVEFADRTLAEEVVRKFDAQPFQGRNLAVSEARAREDRPPPRPPGAGGYGSPRPSGGGYGGGGGAYGARPSGGFSPGPGGRDRTANFGPPAPPRRLRGGKKSQGQDHKVRGPIKEKATGRFYAGDDVEEDTALDIDNVATSAPKDPNLDTDSDGVTDDAADGMTSSPEAKPGQDGDTDDQT
jgi:cold-inducible RNA-binding protein